MKKFHLGLSFLVLGAASSGGLAGCGGDDNGAPPGSGGSGGTTVTTTTAGGGGKSAGGSAGTAGTAGTSGAGGSGGGSTPDAADAKADVGDCGTPGVIHTIPTVPSGIAAPAGVALVGGYHAVGEQIYTCTAGADGGAGSWVNTAVATLYGDNCSVAANHTFAPGPTWAAVPDGSTIMATRVNGVAAPVADGGDGGVTAIAWVLLRAVSNTGEGIFTNVTYVHRIDTTGGVGPSGACDVGDAGPAQRVPYTATYYFYTGGNAEAGGDSSTTDSGTD